MHLRELDQLTQQQLSEEGVAGLGKRVKGFLFFVLALLLQRRNVWSASAVVIAYGIYDHYQGAASELLFRATGALVFLLAAYRLHKKEGRAAADRESLLNTELAVLRTKREVDSRSRDGLLNDIARLREDVASAGALRLQSIRLAADVRALNEEVCRLKTGPILKLEFDPNDRNCHGEGRFLAVKLVNGGEKASRVSVLLEAARVDGRDVPIEPNQTFPLAHDNTYTAEVSPGIPSYFVLFTNKDHAGNREQGLATWSLALRKARMPLTGHSLELLLRIQADVRAPGARLTFNQRTDIPSFLGFDSLIQVDS